MPTITGGKIDKISSYMFCGLNSGLYIRSNSYRLVIQSVLSFSSNINSSNTVIIEGAVALHALRRLYCNSTYFIMKDYHFRTIEMPLKKEC